MRTGKEAIIIPSANDENTRRKSPRSRKWLAQRSLRGSGGAEKRGVEEKSVSSYKSRKRFSQLRKNVRCTYRLPGAESYKLDKVQNADSIFVQGTRVSLFSKGILSLSRERERKSISSIVFHRRGISIMLRRL